MTLESTIEINPVSTTYNIYENFLMSFLQTLHDQKDLWK
jgi:hypothetical protein